MTTFNTPQELAADIALELRTNPSSWTQKTMAKDAEGHSIWASDSRAVCWCLAGHVEKRLGAIDTAGIVHEFYNRVRAAGRFWHAVDIWNDEPHQTANAIASVLELVAATP